MKLACVKVGDMERTGIVRGNQIVFFPVSSGDMVDLIKLGLGKLSELEAASNETLPIEGAHFLPPIRRFRRDVLCTGWNYWDHFEEGIGKRDGQEVERPIAPTFFNKAPNALIGAREDIAFDLRISQKWDYEGEIAIIIGKEGRSIPSDRAVDHVFGYALANDVSQRDLQRRHGGQWFKGKSIDRSTPLGPYLVTADEIDLPSVRLETFVNGEKRQDAYAKQMAFNVGQLIAELSFGMTLYPGDVILTGTPSGIGMARDPQVFLKNGDEIVVRGTGLGELRNRVVETDLYGNSDVALA
ncbi:fumarylacetoacetate hydrolase family protein [Microvirga guangxiensis]|uniref:2-keto-4-pentenoate hydratase/2-oxohepta-3-ene-1,7-dioic acid hydratase (Catechol pathway) n=1 Tax=Microvirga guangxiensis TaxID=549386 RepID=A0A1G5L1Z0_9HYPH|nr:fumarylacetoacetate hydrolase family protein [Microvirga guangxiensis]SCZ06451.1 2-keto-4-pentenoate hydratase/2-oxohepta-3-ene-1,7-dioic acid hydratase (catechol pathway) [Microvirga guangxiensis]